MSKWLKKKGYGVGKKYNYRFEHQKFQVHLYISKILEVLTQEHNDIQDRI